MASAARAKLLLDSLDEDVEGLKEAVNKLAEAARQVSTDKGGEERSVPGSSKPETIEVAHP